MNVGNIWSVLNSGQIMIMIGDDKIDGQQVSS
jgi:hypothetical protein